MEVDDNAKHTSLLGSVLNHNGEKIYVRGLRYKNFTAVIVALS